MAWRDIGIGRYDGSYGEKEFSVKGPPPQEREKNPSSILSVP